MHTQIIIGQAMSARSRCHGALAHVSADLAQCISIVRQRSPFQQDVIGQVQDVQALIMGLRLGQKLCHLGCHSRCMLLAGHKPLFAGLYGFLHAISGITKIKKIK